MSLYRKYFQQQPRARTLIAIGFLFLIPLWLSFYFYLDQSVININHTWLLTLIIIFSLLISSCLLSLDLYFQQKKVLVKLTDELNTKIKQCSQLNSHLAYIDNHDHSTKLPNRNAIENHLQQLIEKQLNFSIFSLSLNNYYFLSDTHGDELIELLFIELIARFEYLLEKRQFIGRIEVDKIMIVCSGMSCLNAQKVAKAICKALEEEFSIKEQEILLFCSIGITEHQGDDQNHKTLIHQANMALRKAKSQTHSSIATYRPCIQKALNDKKNLEQALKYAIHNNELSLNFQPQIDLSFNKIIGIEALIRWLDRKGKNLMSPELIIKTAEKSGLMVKLAHWVMEAALKHYALLLDERCAPNMISINASGFEFEDGAFAEHISRLLDYYDIPASRVQIELSEKAFARNIDNLIQGLLRLSQLGVSLAINDFGTGYLSLYYLKQLPINLIKIDRCFISGLANSKEDMVICQSVISMAQRLQINVISVGVENQEQQSMLENIGCRLVQGCHFYPPLPFKSLLELLKAEREKRSSLSYQERDHAK